MSKKKRRNTETKKEIKETKSTAQVGFSLLDNWDEIFCLGYTSLDRNPEVFAAVNRIARLISSMTLYLMSNEEDGDHRIQNELSRKLDIDPNSYMTRRSYFEYLVTTLLLTGSGNAVVKVHTKNGILTEFEPIPPSLVSFIPDGYKYKIDINGQTYEPDDVLHFVDNPDPNYPWKGRGFTTTIRDVANNLKQAQETTKGFLSSKWKPSIIVKADGMVEGFSGPEGRKKLLKEYVENDEIGQPWIIPADHFDVQEVRPLSLKDLAIADTVKLDKQTVASIIGVPAFLLGVGEFNAKEWNTFIETTVKAIAQEIEQEITKKIIISPKWYVRFNITSLKSWDIDTIAKVFGDLYTKGIVTGNEVRDKLAMSPMDGLDELVVLENYIPLDNIGDQSKLK